MKNSKSDFRNRKNKPYDTQHKSVDPKVRTLASLAEYSYHRNPISTVVVFTLAIITAPIWYPICFLIKNSQLVVVSILVLAMTQCSIKVYDHYIEEPKREAVIIRNPACQDTN